MKTQLYIIAAVLLTSSVTMKLQAQTGEPAQTHVPPQLLTHYEQIAPLSTTIFVPNAFTPNGDGRNDVFSVYGSGLSEMEVSIFDLRGSLVYQWHGLNGSWNGSSGTKAVEQNIYIYIINAKGNEGGEIRKTGTVTVMR